MRTRPSSRILLLDPLGSVLLFRYYITRPDRADEDYWGTIGGGLEANESFEQAAERELVEEIGQYNLTLKFVADRTVVFDNPAGETIKSIEKYFGARTTNTDIDTSNWTELEREVIIEHRWWSQADILASSETIWPEHIVEMIKLV